MRSIKIFKFNHRQINNFQAPYYMNIKWNDPCFERASKFQLLGVWMATRQLILELPCWSDSKESQQLRVYYLRECRKVNLPREIDITIYCTKIRPLLECASPVWGSLSKYLAEELQSIQQVPRYHRDTKNIPSNVRGQMQSSDEAWIRKNCEWCNPPKSNFAHEAKYQQRL